MSKQLTFSAILSVLAMAALALAMTPESRGGEARAATAHGSFVRVMLF